MLIFFGLQPNFKDYPVYLAKFKHCLSKAMHFMKIFIVNTLQHLTSQLTKRVRKPHISSSYTVHSSVWRHRYCMCTVHCQYLTLFFLPLRIQWVWPTQTTPLHFIMLSFEQLHQKLGWVFFMQHIVLHEPFSVFKWDFLWHLFSLSVPDWTGWTASREDPRVSIGISPPLMLPLHIFFLQLLCEINSCLLVLMRADTISSSMKSTSATLTSESSCSVPASHPPLLTWQTRTAKTTVLW